MKGLERSTRVLLLLLVMGIWGLLLAPLIKGGAVEAQTRRAFARWEYTICNSNKVAEWNRFGDQGWEAIAMDPQGMQLLMKRPIR